jgi:hypothetical protein
MDGDGTEFNLKGRDLFRRKILDTTSLNNFTLLQGGFQNIILIGRATTSKGQVFSSSGLPRAQYRTFI